MDKVGFVCVHGDEGAFETGVAGFNTFYLIANERKTSDKALGDVVVKGGATVFGEEFHGVII